MKTLRQVTSPNTIYRIPITPIIKRVSDEEATNLVKSGDWEYCPKHLWKAQKGNTHASQTQDKL